MSSNTPPMSALREFSQLDLRAVIIAKTPIIGVQLLGSVKIGGFSNLRLALKNGNPY